MSFISKLIKFSRSGLLLAAMLACLGGNAYASADPHRDAARELFSAMDMQSMLDQLIQQTLNMQIQRNPGMEPFREVMEVFFREYLSFDSLQEDFVDAYIEAFSTTELQELAAFYRTPVGAKALRVTPQLFQRGAEIGQRNVMANMHVLERRMTQAAKALKKQKESALDIPQE